MLPLTKIPTRRHYYHVGQLAQRLDITPGCILHELVNATGVTFVASDDGEEFGSVAEIESHLEKFDQSRSSVEIWLTDEAEERLASDLGCEVAEMQFDEVRS